MSNIEKGIYNKIPANCPQQSVDITIPVNAKGFAVCASQIPGNPVCEKCSLKNGIPVDTRKDVNS